MSVFVCWDAEDATGNKIDYITYFNGENRTSKLTKLKIV